VSQQRVTPSIASDGGRLGQLIVPILGFAICLLILVWPIAAKCPGDCAPPPSDWPQFQHDGRHTGYNAQETYLSMLNVGALDQSWKSGPLSLDSSGYQVDPVVHKGVLYVTEIANRASVILHAMDARTGAPLWNTQLSFAEFTSVSPAAVYGDVVYLAMSYAASPQNYYLAVAAVSATTHQLVWTSTPNVHTNPVLINVGRSYTLTVNDGVVAVCATGKSVENHFVNGTMLTYKAKTGALLATHWVQEFCIPPVVAGERVYYTSGRLTAADVNSLASLWDSSGSPFGLALGNSGYLIGTPFSNSIRAWDHVSGTMKWELQPAPASSPFWGGWAAPTPAVANGFAYLVTGAFRLYKLYESTGTVVWTLVIVDENIESAPALANDVLFLIAGGKLIALNATTGYILYSHANADGAPFAGTPVIANGMVYVHAADAKGEYIYAFAPPARDGA
jgi:outer membrane protein assembly factor BamB